MDASALEPTLPRLAIEARDGRRITIGSLYGVGPAVVVLQRATSCLACMVELEQWKAFAERVPGIKVFLILVGKKAVARDLMTGWESDIPLFLAVMDDQLDDLTVTPTLPIRMLTGNGRVLVGTIGPSRGDESRFLRFMVGLAPSIRSSPTGAGKP